MSDSITADERNERGIGCYMDGKWLVDVLLPGFIVAHSGIQGGEPTLIGTRLPTYVGLGWVWDSLSNPRQEHLTREKIIALAAFQAGVEWQRSRKRRKRIDEAVEAGWKVYWEEEESAGLGCGGGGDGTQAIADDGGDRGPDGRPGVAGSGLRFGDVGTQGHARREGRATTGEWPAGREAQ